MTKKRKLDPNIIRVGDWVQIINPVFVLRCGYPITFDMACDYIRKEYIKEINVFRDTIRDRITGRPLSPNNRFILEAEHNKNDKLSDKLIRAFAYEYLSHKIVNGTERKLYTQTIEACKENSVLVNRIKIVKTGFHYPASGGYDSWSGEYDYEPGGLLQERTHKLLEVTFCANYSYKVTPYFENKINEPCIEACNVRKLERKEK